MRHDTDLICCFPRAAIFGSLCHTVAATVREARPHDSLSPFSERHLQCVWADSTWRPEILCSHTGEQVRVEHAGRWNLEAGPDFLDAILLIGPDRRRVQGDVEVHIRPSDWIGHGHANDSRYDAVAAHVCYHDGNSPAGILPPGTIQISLRDALKSDPAFAFEGIDVTAYPYAAMDVDRPPCADVLATWSPDRREAILDAAGEERIRGKALRLQAAMGEMGEEQCFYEEIMGALGYKHNQQAFRQLARRVPWDSLRNASSQDPVKGYALLLGVAGLIPMKGMGYDRETRAFVRRLWDHWWKEQSQWSESVMIPRQWKTAGLRPQNHPIRRLAAAAAVFSTETSIVDRLKAFDPSEPRAWFRHATDLLERTATLEYWKRRLTFTGKLGERDTALIGEQRSAAILSNVVIPFLAAAGSQVTALLDHLPPEQDNALIRQTAFAMFGRDHNPALYRKGLRQQGLLQIFYDFCINTRTGCPNCAFAAALANSPPHDRLLRP